MPFQMLTPKALFSGVKIIKAMLESTITGLHHL
jgi:hypothetical protein